MMKADVIFKSSIFQYVPVLVYTFCRYWVALVITSYGGAKIFKGQFSVPLSILDTPLGEVSGFYLTWSFFGASYSYSLFVAILQIAAAVLLLHRRTTLLGALLLFPILVNILLIDIFYEILFSATVNALILLLMTTVIVLSHWKVIVLFFGQMQEAVFIPLLSKRKYFLGLKFIVRSTTLVLPIFLAFVIRFYNNIAPTSIDGKWYVEKIELFSGEAFSSLQGTEIIYFEPDFAYRSSIRKDGKVRSASFFVDEEERKVEIKSREGKALPVFVGRFELTENDSSLMLMGRWEQDSVLLNLSKYPIGE